MMGEAEVTGDVTYSKVVVGRLLRTKRSAEYLNISLSVEKFEGKNKGKVIPVQSMQACAGVEAWFQSFLISGLVGGELSALDTP
jgi:hypothetical protein